MLYYTCPKGHKTLDHTEVGNLQKPLAKVQLTELNILEK